MDVSDLLTGQDNFDIVADLAALHPPSRSDSPGPGRDVCFDWLAERKGAVSRDSGGTGLH